MTELRTQINIMLTPKANASISITKIVDTEEEAHELGAELNRLMTAWCRGWDEEAAKHP